MFASIVCAVEVKIVYQADYEIGVVKYPRDRS